MQYIKALRDDIHKKINMFKWALPVKRSPPPPRLNGQGGPFFRPPKTTFYSVLQTQIQIDFENENYDFCDEINNNFDDYGDENDKIPI